MLAGQVVQCWGRILAGYRPELTVEITRECPLNCPGCYAYAPQHVAGEFALRSLSDLKGQPLIDGVLDLVRTHRPLHVTLVGGEPLVRYRELEEMLPRMLDLGVHVQLVTSAVRPIPAAWKSLPRFNLSVSVDGLQPEHDARRKPATYERILQHVNGHRATIHCTVTGQQMRRESYIEEFVRFWSDQACTKRIWMSLYTPQVGEQSPECLSDEDRRRATAELKRLRPLYPRLDMGPLVLSHFTDPPASPRQCALANLATCISADLRTPLTPCQLGGTPDCARCGCMAAAGVGAVARYRLFGLLPLSVLVTGSEAIGALARRLRHLSTVPGPSGLVRTRD